MKTKMRRLILFCTAILLVGGSLIALIPAHVSADGPVIGSAGAEKLNSPPPGSTVAYTDLTTIHVKATFISLGKSDTDVQYNIDSDFVDRNVFDEKVQYTNNANGCASTISFPYNNGDTPRTNATITLSAPDPANNNSCYPVTYSQNINGLNGSVFLDWSSATEIQSIQGGLSLEQEAGTPQTFTGKTGADLIDQSCGDSLSLACKKGCTETLTVDSDDVYSSLKTVCKNSSFLSLSDGKHTTYINHAKINGSPSMPVTNPPLSAGSDDNGDGTAQTPTLSCGTLFNPLNWVICPIVKGMTNIIGQLDNFIDSQLTVGSPGSSDNPNQIFCDGTSQGNANVTCNEYYQAWQTVRDLSLGILAIIGLVIVISEALGFEVLSAYAVRKTLPRLLFAAIGITLSWQLLRFFVLFTNDLGLGVRSLIYAPFSNFKGGISLGGNATVATSLLAAPAIASLGIFGTLSFALTGALAVFVAFLVLVVRQLVIIVLLIFAPLAIVSYILPNTQRMYKLWWDSFGKALMMFPLISAFIASGRVLAKVSSANSNDAVGQLIGFAAYFAPYFLIPLTFRLAGGALSTIGGFMNDRSRGAFDGLKNFRSNQTKQRRANALERAKSQRVFRTAPEGSVRAGLNRRVQTATLLNEAGLRRKNWKSNIEGARTAHENDSLAKAGEKSSAFRAIMGNDDTLEAARLGAHDIGAARRHLESKNFAGSDLTSAMGLIMKAQKDLGIDGLELAAATANMGSSTGLSEGAGDAYDQIAKASHNNMVLAANALAQGRKAATDSRRYDLLDGGFSAGLGHMQRIMAAPNDAARTAAIQEVNAEAADFAVETQGIGAVLGGKGRSGKNLAPAMQRRIERAEAALREATTTGQDVSVTRYDSDGSKLATKTITPAQAQREFIQTMAFTSAAIDSSGQAAPEISRLIADTVHDKDIDLSSLPPEFRDSVTKSLDGISPAYSASKMKASELMERLERNPEFAQIKKVYSRQATEEAAARNAAGGPPAGGPGGPQPGQPLGPIVFNP